MMRDEPNSDSAVPTFAAALTQIAGDLYSIADAVRDLSRRRVDDLPVEGQARLQAVDAALMRTPRVEEKESCRMRLVANAGIQLLQAPMTPGRTPPGVAGGSPKLGSPRTTPRNMKSPRSDGPRVYTSEMTRQPPVIDCLEEWEAGNEENCFDSEASSLGAINHLTVHRPQPKSMQKSGSALASSNPSGGSSLPKSGSVLTAELPLRDAWASVEEHLVEQYVEKVKMTKPAFLAGRSSASFLIAFGGKSFSMTSLASSTLPLAPWLISPLSKKRLLWDLASIIFLANDVIMVPLEVFDVPDEIALDVVQLICALFWMGDIVMSLRTSFFTGLVLEASAWSVATHYLTTWFFPDFLVILVQWLWFLPGHDIFKVLQLVRFVRLRRLQRLRRAVIERSTSNHVHLYVDSVRVAIGFAIAVHLITCGWYWLGEAVHGGWVHAESLRGKDIYHHYFHACRWTIAQVSGRTDLEARSTEEYIYTCCACMFGLIALSVLISSITNTMIELATLNRERLSQFRLLNAYLKRNHTSPALSLAAKTGLSSHQSMAVNYAREQEVLSVLPKQIMMDLLYEIREPLLKEHQLFSDLKDEFPRCVRRICAEAIKFFAAHEDEIVFAKGDACTRMLIIQSGTLTYYWKKRAPQKRISTVSRPSLRGNTVANALAPKFSEATVATAKGITDSLSRLGSMPVSQDGEMLCPKQWISEAALWVEWENRGECAAGQQCSALALESQEFSNVAKLFKDARARCVVYARTFAKILEEADALSDVMDPLRSYLDIEGYEMVIQTIGSEREIL